MTEKIPVRVQFKRMTQAEWRASNIVLLEGELGFETDTGYAKFGDGVNTFPNLKYLWGPAGPQGEKGEKGDPGETRFEALTEEQRESLKGPRGQDGTSITTQLLTQTQYNELVIKQPTVLYLITG